MRNWLVFSSSSGQTFSAAWDALSRTAQETCEGFFVDRACGALDIARSRIGANKVHDFSGGAFEEKFFSWCEKNIPGLEPEEKPIIFLIGYFKIITPAFVQRDLAIVNTHPSLLPSFPGLDKKVHAMAFERCLVSGFSVHVVSEELDAGPIIFQKTVDIANAQSADEVRERVRSVEQKYLPRVINNLLLTRLEGKHRKCTTRELQSVEGFPICVD